MKKQKMPAENFSLKASVVAGTVKPDPAIGMLGRI